MIKNTILALVLALTLSLAQTSFAKLVPEQWCFKCPPGTELALFERDRYYCVVPGTTKYLAAPVWAKPHTAKVLWDVKEGRCIDNYIRFGRDFCYRCPKGFRFVGDAVTDYRVNVQHISYQVHVKDYGWLPATQDGNMAGTTGESRRMEAIRIKVEGLPNNCKLQYNVHAANIGWMGWVNNGAIAGTTGQSRRLEAIRIKLEGCPQWRVEYKVHAANIGWMGSKFDGQVAGTTGQSRRIEAIKIWLRRR